ncbi:MAG: heavy metal translocating P-type ATPase [Chloroflexota bacterium]
MATTVSNLQKQTFTITGMDCAGCAKSVESAVSKLEGVVECTLNFTTEKLHVSGDINKDEVIGRVRQAGFDVAHSIDSLADGVEEETQPQNFLQFMWQRFETRLALLGVLLILPGLAEELAGIEHWLIDICSFGALLVAGWPVARSAWRVVTINREININVLMTVAAVGAVIIGAYAEAGMVMVLFAIGEALEGYTASRARHSIRSLMDVAPQLAMRLKNETGRNGTQVEETVHINGLQVGDVILVKPGERIAMDGRVIAGASSVNQAAITGESRLVEKSLDGDGDVFAGSVNGEGALEVAVTQLAEDNTISRVIRMVEEAQERQAPAQRFMDRFAAIYTPIVMIIALAVAIVPPLFLGEPFWNPDPETFGWLYRGLTLLVVACPCALVISTPVSIISAISNAARNGVLVKGGAYIEALSRVRAVALDKTGTLTQGRPAVMAVRSAHCEAKNEELDNCIPCNDVVALAAAVEQRSEHPLAHAILSESTRRGLGHRYPSAEGITALTGKGIVGTVDGRSIYVGSHASFDGEVAHSHEHCVAATADASNGTTPMMVSADGDYLGTITVADSVRESSKAAVAEMKAAGIRDIIMLTGDNAGTAQAIADEVGVTDVRAELLPGDKLNAIEELQMQYGSVAMVGDGINDAPALARADVGIAIGGATGTAQAMETADVTLMSEDLRQLSFALRLAKSAMQTIQANVIMSIGIKLAFLVLVLLGVGTMWMAVLADMGTSLLVTLNGMRLLRFERHKRAFS